MINFIICDDNKKVVSKVKNIINKLMMKNNIGYQMHCYYDYDSTFREIIDEELANKIYILDIETPSASGIDIVRKIRADDYSSTIIFLTIHEELGYTLLKKEYSFLAFINKYDNYEQRLYNALKISLRKINCSRMIQYYNNGVLYKLPLDDILYVSRDSVERKCFIKTAYSEVLISKQLNEIKEDLSDSFVYSHRSCIVNKDRIRSIDFRNRIITFDNEITTTLLSNTYKKEIC